MSVVPHDGPELLPPLSRSFDIMATVISTASAVASSLAEIRVWIINGVFGWTVTALITIAVIWLLTVIVGWAQRARWKTRQFDLLHERTLEADRQQKDQQRTINHLTAALVRSPNPADTIGFQVIAAVMRADEVLLVLNIPERITTPSIYVPSAGIHKRASVEVREGSLFLVVDGMKDRLLGLFEATETEVNQDRCLIKPIVAPEPLWWGYMQEQAASHTLSTSSTVAYLIQRG
jgi:hypothetical protein